MYWERFSIPLLLFFLIPVLIASLVEKNDNLRTIVFSSALIQSTVFLVVYE